MTPAEREADRRLADMFAASDDAWRIGCSWAALVWVILCGAGLFYVGGKMAEERARAALVATAPLQVTYVEDELGERLARCLASLPFILPEAPLELPEGDPFPTFPPGAIETIRIPDSMLGVACSPVVGFWTGPPGAPGCPNHQ